MLRKFDISCCFVNGPSTLDPQVVSDTVQPFLPENSPFSTLVVSAHSVFNEGRFSHTNVRVEVGVETYAQALDISRTLTDVTGKRWNAPTQDPDQVEQELGPDAKTWGLFTAEGAVKLTEIINGLERDIRDGNLSPFRLEAELKARTSGVELPGYGDTAVREEVWGYLDEVLEDLGVSLRR